MKLFKLKAHSSESSIESIKDKTLSVKINNSKQRPFTSFSSEPSSISYISLSERRKTTEHAKPIAKQADERVQRQIKILRQTFELEKHNLREEALIVKKNAIVAEFENYANSELYDKINISRVNWEIMPKHFEKKTLRNTAISFCCQAFSIDSYSDTLSDFSSMSATSAPDNYNQNIKLNKNKHNKNVNNPQCTHIHPEESDITNKHLLNNKFTSHNIIKKEQSSLCNSINNFQ